MYYTSGTTGRPKGVILTARPVDPETYTAGLCRRFGIDADTVCLFPGPLYHGTPNFLMDLVLRSAGTAVVMECFDAKDALAAIERYSVTHSYFVPTMLIRMLKLPDEVKARYDLSSHRWSLHTAAPCPMDVKKQIIDWWGPVLCESYGGTERNGITVIDSLEWLEHPGTVGKAFGTKIWILDEDDEPVPPGVEGLICFSGGPDFEYHGDPEKTRDAYHGEGRSTIGDIGYLDAEGYLFLTDRAANLIISGGVNIYPRESEDVLIEHDAVDDVAVIGVPHSDLGEIPEAFVQLRQGTEGSDELAAELIALCRSQLASIKCPRRVSFVNELPRLPTGKLLKHRIRQAYLT